MTQENPDIFEDGFNISNPELIIRAQKWINLIPEKSYQGKIEKFPEQKKNPSVKEKSIDIGKNVLGALGSNFKNTTSFINPMNYVRLVGNIATNGDEIRKINNTEIIELSTGYLTILEMRSLNDEFMKKKFDEFVTLRKDNIQKYSEQKSKKWF